MSFYPHDHIRLDITRPGQRTKQCPGAHRREREDPSPQSLDYGFLVRDKPHVPNQVACSRETGEMFGPQWKVQTTQFLGLTTVDHLYGSVEETINLAAHE